jgi:hypothetical protein
MTQPNFCHGSLNPSDIAEGGGGGEADPTCKPRYNFKGLISLSKPTHKFSVLNKQI